MKKRFLLSAVFFAMVFAPGLAYAQDAAYEESAEPLYSLRVSAAREDLMATFGSEIHINQVSDESWFWITPDDFYLQLYNDGFDMGFFLRFDRAGLSFPQIPYLLDAWGWNPWSFIDMDAPAISISTSPGTAIEFNFHITSFQKASWGGALEVDMETEGGYILPGSVVVLPQGSSFTALLIQGAYDFGVPFGTGNILLLIETIGDDGRLPPVYSFRQEEHVPSSWAREYFEQAESLGIIPEFLGLSLRRYVNRAEFAAYLTALFETASQSEIPGRVNFVDTEDLNLQKIGFLGIIGGDSDGNANPSTMVNRRQAAVMLSNTLEVMGVRLPVPSAWFHDQDDIGNWEHDAVMQMFGAGVMGANEGFFEPGRLLTRQETILLMVRLYHIIQANSPSESQH